MLFHVKCPECGSHIVKTRAPTAADANSEFDKAIGGIKLLAGREQVELFCPNGHKLAFEEIGPQMVEQCRAFEARVL